MSKFEIEMVLKDGHSAIGEASDEKSALDFLDRAIQRYPTGHIRIRCGTVIVSERLPPKKS